MKVINWQQFGLKSDPYDTLPLQEGGGLPIDKAFIGRKKELELLNSLFISGNRLCLTICGDVGVGKTSLANFHKTVWKQHRGKELFSFRREIEAHSELLNKRAFLIEIIGSVLREIKLIQPELLENELLGKLNKIVDISQVLAISSVGANAFGFGLNVGVDKATNFPLQLAITSLEEYFIKLINFIKTNEINGKKHKGLIIHVNNFDVILSKHQDIDSKKIVINFFNEIRDILQTPDTYFLFLGPNELFKEIIGAQQRVKSIFYQTPLNIKPLSKLEIVEAFNERMRLLKSDAIKSYIKPVDDETVFRLYDLYQGDIRSIMASVRDILGQMFDNSYRTLSVDESMLLLGKERWERIENVLKLTKEQKEILQHLAYSEKFVTQKEIAGMFKKAQANVSGYYFKPLREHGIIEEKQRKGKMIYFGLTADYKPLKWLAKYKTENQKSLQQKLRQLDLFD